MKYLFICAGEKRENQTKEEKKEINNTEVVLVSTESDYRVVERYYRSTEDEKHAYKEQEVAAHLVAMMNECDVVVVWRWSVYDWICQMAERNQVTLPVRRLVIVKEILSAVDAFVRGCHMNYERVIRRYHIPYNREKLSSMIEISRYLILIYSKAKSVYLEVSNERKDGLPWLVENTNKVHTKDCIKLKSQITKERKANIAVEELWEGAMICNCCYQDRGFQIMPEHIHLKAESELKQIEESVQRLCNRLHLQCTFAAGIIFIRSNYASWRIYHSQGHVERLYHENYRYSLMVPGRKTHKFKGGYHEQHLMTRNIKRVIYYIARHDKKFLERDENLLVRE